MQLLEATGKAILARAGLQIPDAQRLEPQQRAAELRPALREGDIWVKAQVPLTGRAALGGVRRVCGAHAIDAAIAQMERDRVGGLQPLGYLIEAHVASQAELFIGIVFDQSERLPALVVSAAGGGGVEQSERVGRVAWDPAYPLYPYKIRDACELAGVSPDALLPIAPVLADVFRAEDAMLLEVNPLLVRADGSCIVGDVHLVVDDNAEFRHSERDDDIARLATLDDGMLVRLKYGFDYTVLDPYGQIGFITTGAGATMMLLDAFAEKGASVFNFADVRTGGLRGDPARLLAIADRLVQAPRVRSVLVNVFGGVTDVAEVAQLLIDDVLPRLIPRMTVTIRLVGRGGKQARALLNQSLFPVNLAVGLDEAIEMVLAGCR